MSLGADSYLVADTALPISSSPHEGKAADLVLDSPNCTGINPVMSQNCKAVDESQLDILEESIENGKHTEIDTTILGVCVSNCDLVVTNQETRRASYASDSGRAPRLSVSGDDEMVPSTQHNDPRTVTSSHSGRDGTRGINLHSLTTSPMRSPPVKPAVLKLASQEPTISQGGTTPGAPLRCQRRIEHVRIIREEFINSSDEVVSTRVFRESEVLAAEEETRRSSSSVVSHRAELVSRASQTSGDSKESSRKRAKPEDSLADFEEVEEKPRRGRQRLEEKVKPAKTPVKAPKESREKEKAPKPSRQTKTTVEATPKPKPAKSDDTPSTERKRDTFVKLDEPRRCFAPWSDKYMYPGYVVSEHSEKCRVHFDDGTKRDVLPIQALSLETIAAKTDEVLLRRTGDEDMFDEVGFTRFISEAEAVVRVNGKDRTVSVSDLQLAPEHTKVVSFSPSSRVCALSSQNIIEDRRPRRSADVFQPPGTSTPGTSKKSSTAADKPKSRGGRSKVVRGSSEESEASNGPKVNLFSNYVFLLSTSSKIDSDEKMERDIMERIITERGGTVCETVEEAITRLGSRLMLLISEQYHRTEKYLYCLASARPCLHFSYINDCIEKSKLLPCNDYLLPAGFSVLENSVQPQRIVIGVFQRKRILIVSTRDSFRQMWTRILVAAKATVTTRMPPQGEDCASDLVLVDTECAAPKRLAALSSSTQLISTEWAIQSLIAGIALSYTANDKFAVNVDRL